MNLREAGLPHESTLTLYNLPVTIQAAGWNRAWGAKAGCPPAWTGAPTQVDARLPALQRRFQSL